MVLEDTGFSPHASNTAALFSVSPCGWSSTGPGVEESGNGDLGS